jgi:hypothetical protein
MNEWYSLMTNRDWWKIEQLWEIFGTHHRVSMYRNDKIFFPLKYNKIAIKLHQLNTKIPFSSKTVMI